MSARAELLAIIARLETMSHVPAVNQSPKAEVGGATTSDERNPGGSRPRGGIDRKDDREPDFALKSADHYRRRLQGCRTTRDVELVLVDARLTLRAWTHTQVRDQPLPGDPLFRRWVNQQLEAGKSQSEIARLSGLTRQRIHQLKDAA